MKLSGRPIEIDGNKITLMLDEPLNIEHIETMYNKPVKDVSFWVEAPDPRHATPAQRRFYFALIGDIFRHYGQPVSDLKDYFEIQFEMATGIEFSMSDTSSTTVSEANYMNDMLIDFIMEHNIPFKKGFEILPQNINRYLFGCIKYRQCAICREHAQIHHHENLVGMGRNRNKIDHSSSKMIALCWKHHDECHRIGLKNFANKYHLVAIKVDEKSMKRIGLRTVQKGNLIEVEDERLIIKDVGKLIEYYERKASSYTSYLSSCSGQEADEITMRIKIYEQFIRDLDNLEGE